MNICIVHPNRSAYSETFVRNHIKYLPGNIFDVYGGWYPAFDGKDKRLGDYYLNRSVWAKTVIAVCKILPAFVANRLSSSVKGYPYDEDLNEDSFRYFLKKHKIHVVLAEFMYRGVLVKDVCAELRIPFVVHTHGGADIMTKESLKMFSASIPDLFEKATRVLSVDSFSSARLLELGLPKHKLKRIGLGIDLSLFTATKPSANPPVFFAVGRFVNMKAPYLTILAFASIIKDYPEAKLIMGGNGSLFDCCFQMVKALKLEGRVEFSGVLTPSQVAGHMQNSRAFVQHSLHTLDNDSEGLPVAVLEAMATGLPVISTFHNGIADTIEHGKDGLLSDETNIEAMASHMRKLLQEPQLADQLGSNARKKVESQFELSKVINELSGILQEAFEDDKSYSS